MTRPADWWVLDLSRDPTPGDPYQVRLLARRVARVSDDAERAARQVRGLASDGSVLSWIGLAGEVFRGALEDFPSQLDKLARSYEQCSSALTAFAGDLDGAQDQADRALEQGRQARAEVASLQSQLGAARDAASAASSAAAGLNRPPAAGAEPPDPAQVRAATRNAQAAASRVSSLSSSLGGAHSRLEAAKRLAREAEELRQAAGDRAKARLHDASDAGITPNSWWEDFTSGAAKVWRVTIQVAKVVVAVLGIVVLIIGGPLAWLVVAAAVLVLADTLAKIARGEAGWMDLLWAALACIPATKGLTTLSGLATGIKGLRSGGVSGIAARAGNGLSAVARDAPLMVSQALTNAPARIQHMAMQLRHASPLAGVRAGAEAFRAARAEGDRVWVALEAAELERFRVFRTGFTNYAAEVSKVDPVRGVHMWQGGNGFFGIDRPWVRQDLTGGEYVVRLTGGTGDFVVDLRNVPQFTDGAAYNQGVQVAPWRGPGTPDYRSGLGIHRIAPDVRVPAAVAPTGANPQFGPGEIPQRFVPGFEELVRSGDAHKVMDIPFDPGTLSAPHIPTAAEHVTIRTATHLPIRAVVYGQTSQNP